MRIPNGPDQDQVGAADAEQPLLLGGGGDGEQTPPTLRESRRLAGDPAAADGAGLAALRDALERERGARLVLTRQIDELREELVRRSEEIAAAPGTVAASERTRRSNSDRTSGRNSDIDSGDSESEFAELWFSSDALRETGLSASEARRLRRLFDEVELEKLEARDRAVREGWSSSSRHSRELREIRDRFREEVGEDNYDRVLYASARNNRVRVGDLLRGSAAEEAGVEVGDVIVSYAGKRVFDPTSLYMWTTEGDRGESVELEVRRADETFVLAIGRGPLGGKMQHFVAAPTP